MLEINKRIKLIAILTVGSFYVNSLSAQFLEANALEAQSYAGVIDQGFVASSSASDFTMTILAAAPGVSGRYGFDGYEADSSDVERLFDSDIEQNSFHIGYTHAFEWLIAGLAVTYLDTELESDFSDNNNVGYFDADGDGWIVSAGVSQNWEALNLLISGGYGSLSQDGERASQSAPVGASTSDLDTELIYFVFEVNYGVDLFERVDLEPFLQLSYNSVETDSFTEGGGAADAGGLDAFDRDWLIGELGIRSKFDLAEDLSISLGLSWIHDFESDEVELDGDFQAVPSPGNAEVSTVGEDRLRGSLEIAYRVNEQWLLVGGADVSSGDDVDTHGLAFSVFCNF